MATALNVTMPLKQDPESQQRLQQLKDNFDKGLQQKVDAALAQSKIVHYARLLVIDDKYLQILTEFDEGIVEYLEFFRTQLPDAFAAVLSLVEGVPPWDQINNSNDFLKVAAKFNVRALGTSPDNPKDGYLFSAYGDTTVREILEKLHPQEA